ncbi:MAG: carbohydrate ABC transporter substrate-binding protein [Spirochaetales bacterium]|nr:carbohydrate ABC transporter substrate-binding protein [Spirochaetales bacterium]
MKKKLFIVLLVALLATSVVFAQGTKDAKKDSLEIFSWWTAGGEADGLDAMIKVFENRYPGIELINATVAGGAGTNAKAVLATRMQGGNPPDTFQVHAGHELIDTWVVSDFMEPITFVLRDAGYLDKFPSDVIDIISYKGEVYSIPVNIHRSNVMWYSPKLFNQFNLKVPTTWAEFLSAAEVFQRNGIPALALGDNESWAATHLMENVLLSTLGADGYRDLWQGKVPWNDSRVREALTIYTKILGYVNRDHAALANMDAAGYVAEGKAAINIMGDWAAGYYYSQGFKQGEDWEWAPAPGTAGIFNMLSDSFGLPKNAPNRDNVIKWLTVCASREGQDAFNPIKGSIPARIDGDRSLYDRYLNAAMDDFARDAIVPSVAHGAAISEPWLTRINDIMALFTTELNVDKAIAEFQAAADRYAP